MRDHGFWRVASSQTNLPNWNIFICDPEGGWMVAQGHWHMGSRAGIQWYPNLLPQAMQRRLWMLMFTYFRAASSVVQNWIDPSGLLQLPGGRGKVIFPALVQQQPHTCAGYSAGQSFGYLCWIQCRPVQVKIVLLVVKAASYEFPFHICLQGALAAGESFLLPKQLRVCVW